MNTYESNYIIRVNKTVARKLYSLGFDVGLCPCQAHPESPWGLRTLYNRYSSPYGCDFDKLVSDFTISRCGYNEVGRYPAYYVEVYTLIHFSFKNGSNPYYFRGSAVECLKELKRWSKNWKVECSEPRVFELEEKRL